jgi:hypothetical protein
MVTENDNPRMTDLLVPNSALSERIVAFKKDWNKFYKKISKEKTPQVDGTGKRIIEKRPWDNLEYIIDAYMDECLDKHFPGWSWKKAGGLTFLGSEYVVADGELYIIDERLLAFGINPPYRVYWGSGAARIAYKKDQPHTPENLVDIDKNVKAANTNAKKVAINRLTGIGDDVYGKRIEEEGAGSLEEVLQASIADGGGATEFGRWVQGNKWKWADILNILGVNSLLEITDYKEAMNEVKKHKGLK